MFAISSTKDCCNEIHCVEYFKMDTMCVNNKRKYDFKVVSRTWIGW